MTALQITAKNDESRSAATVRCKGFIDAHTFDRLEESLDGLLDRGVLRVVVDLGEVTYISSAGLGVLVAAYHQTEERGGILLLARPRPQVRAVLRDTGLEELFVIAKSEDEALRYLDTGGRAGDVASSGAPSAPGAHVSHVARRRRRFQGP